MRPSRRERTLLLLGALLTAAGCAGGFGSLVPELSLDPGAARETVELPTPESVRAGSGDVREVYLAWDPLLGGDVAGYRVERAHSPRGPFEPVGAVEDRFGTTFVDGAPSRSPIRFGNGNDALEDGATYLYRVRAIARDGRVAAEASIPVPGKTAPTPGPPDGFRAFSHQPRRVPLAWRPSDDRTVGSYVVYRSPAEAGPFAPIAVLDDRYRTTYVDEGLGDLRVLYYRIASRNVAGGEGAPSAAVRAVTKPVPLPPVGLRVVERRLGLNRLAWDANVESDLDGYQVFRVRSDGGKREPVTRVDDSLTTAEDRNVAPGEAVSYTLTARDHSGLESVPATPVSVESADYELTAVARGNRVDLRWNPRKHEGYRGARVVRGGPGGHRDLGLVESGRVSDTEVTPGAAYTYIVTLERPDGSAALPSRPVAVTVPAR